MYLAGTGVKDQHRLCVVRWRDAHYEPGEDIHSEALKIHKPAIYWTAGILIQSDAIGVTIGQDLGLPLNPEGERTYRTRTFIPRELIEEEFDAGMVIRTKRLPKVVV